MLELTANESERYVVKRMREMYELTELANNWFDDWQPLSPDSMRQLMSLGGKVQKLLVRKDRTAATFTGSDA